jgi:hypothetical protein
MKKDCLLGSPLRFRRLTVFLILVAAFTLVSTPAASSNTGNDAADGLAYNPAQVSVTDALNETVKTAISPLLVLFIKLAAHQFRSEPLKVQDDVLSPALSDSRALLVVVGLFLLLTLFKDCLPVSLLKKPLDAGEVQVAPLLSLLRLALTSPGLIEHLTPAVAQAIQVGLNNIGPAQLYAAVDPNVAATGVSALAEWLGGMVVAVTGAIVYSTVWLLSNTLTILCLVVPAALGPVVKSGRLALLGFLHTLSVYHPWLALLFSLAILIIAFLISRWAFKLTVWGGLYSFDLLLRTWRKRKPGPEPMAFVTGAGRKKLKTAKRTLGRLSMENGRLIFRYRLFLLFPRKIELPAPEQLALGRRLTAPVLLLRLKDRHIPLLAFRLSSRTHEDLLAQRFGGLEVLEVGLSKWLKGAFSWMDKEASRLKTSTAPV